MKLPESYIATEWEILIFNFFFINFNNSYNI
jgi:hypothetical protein